MVSNKVIWVSGSNGTVGRSVDGGLSWKWMKVKGFEKTDFRDIEAFDQKTAVIMGVDEPAYILRTSDGGNSWKVVYKNLAKGMFLDAMAFWNNQTGYAVGDPIDGQFFMVRALKGGKIWQEVPESNRPVADSGEACFAASGTNLRALSTSETVFVSGGLSSHIFLAGKKLSLPMAHGTESEGANSVAVKNTRTWVVVGGDFLHKDSTYGNCAVTFDGGLTWHSPTKPPAGYRSCVEYLSKNKWITCGLTGVDISGDNGMTWEPISDQGFNVCRKAKKGSAVYFAGSGGRIARLQE